MVEIDLFVTFVANCTNMEDDREKRTSYSESAPSNQPDSPGLACVFARKNVLLETKVNAKNCTLQFALCTPMEAAWA